RRGHNDSPSVWSGGPAGDAARAAAASWGLLFAAVAPAPGVPPVPASPPRHKLAGDSAVPPSRLRRVIGHTDHQTLARAALRRQTLRRARVADRYDRALADLPADAHQAGGFQVLQPPVAGLSADAEALQGPPRQPHRAPLLEPAQEPQR